MSHFIRKGATKLNWQTVLQNGSVVGAGSSRLERRDTPSYFDSTWIELLRQLADKMS